MASSQYQWSPINDANYAAALASLGVAGFNPDNVDNGASDAGPGPGPDLSRFANYQLGQYIDGGKVNTAIMDPSGNVSGQYSWMQPHKSLTGSDYAQIASILGIAATGGLGGASGVGSSLYGLDGVAGAAAGGATIGAAGGAINSAGNGQNALTGALKGGLLGGIGGAAGSYFGGSPTSQPIDQMTLPDGWGDVSNITNPIDSALSQQPLPLDASGSVPSSWSGSMASGNLPPIQYLNGNDVERFTATGSSAPLPTMADSMPSLAQSPGLDPSSMQMPNFNTALAQQSQSLPQMSLVNSGSMQMPELGKVAAPAAAVGGGSMLSQLADATGLTAGQLTGAGALLGAVAGSKGTPGMTTTTQSRTDPRFDPYLYGSGGLLQAAQDTYNANKTPNADMQSGWAAQRGLLTDPAIASQLQQFRNQGQGLLSAPVAQNPFTTGKAKLIGG